MAVVVEAASTSAAAVVAVPSEAWAACPAANEEAKDLLAASHSRSLDEDCPGNITPSHPAAVKAFSQSQATYLLPSSGSIFLFVSILARLPVLFLSGVGYTGSASIEGLAKT